MSSVDRSLPGRLLIFGDGNYGERRSRRVAVAVERDSRATRPLIILKFNNIAAAALDEVERCVYKTLDFNIVIRALDRSYNISYSIYSIRFIWCAYTRKLRFRTVLYLNDL